MINQSNLKNYLLDTYGYRGTVSEFILSAPEPLLQSEYGGINDCTITSMTELFCTLMGHKHSPTYVYKNVEKEARDYFFTNKYGMPIPMVPMLLKRMIKVFKLNYKTTRASIKDLGYNFNSIKSIIDKKQLPIMLYCTNDGFNYYEGHSILIIGYAICGGHHMLAVHDNWSKEIRYVDYAKLGKFSCIDYIK